ncbi:MAG: sulfatase-like hydrolase/transferase [Verrucomicrobiales bacterium]|nr:sulfatase-like hydrolase/transferase [Verrucomicrobiales bacterium]
MRIHIWILAVCVMTAGALKAADRPNILWLSAEDISPHLGCYGDANAITPHLDKLATEGMRYTHAFTTAGVCAPCRSGIITGMYQTTLGTHHMRCKAVLPEHIKPFPMYLREAGYYCTNNSKTDYQFRHPKETWDFSGRKGHWRNRKKGQPFFAVFNFTGCHESGIASEAKYKSVTADLKPSQRQDAKKLTLPPYYPDTPIVREDWKRNYELITAMDAWAGNLIAQLKADGLYENTIIFFWSDHGVGLPRAKRWLYDSGTRVPLIVRMPKSAGLKAGVNNRLVSSIDFGPTVLNLAGLEIPKYMQGRSFIGGTPRKFVFGARDRMDERYDIIRSVRGPRYRYIRNYEPLKTYYQYMNTPEKGATMREIRRVADAGKLPPAAKLFIASTKPTEELYDLETDPHEIHNLAGERKHADKLKELRAAHSDWVKRTGDLGLLPEAEIEIREKATSARYNILKGKSKLNAQLGNAAAMASSGVYALPSMIQAMQHPDAAVRYWGATGVGNIGPQAINAKRPMMDALKDKSPSVRIAAARALAKLGESKLALSVLEAELQSEHQWGRLAAAIVLDEMDAQAKPAIPALKRALENQPNKYIVRVANRALNELQGTKNVVP